MAGFTKDVVYYRGDITYKCGVGTSSFLGEDAINPKSLATDLRIFIEDADATKFEIVRHEAKKGDALAHTAGVEIRLVRKNNKIYVEGGQNG